jgi:hypothetical protein
MPAMTRALPVLWSALLPALALAAEPAVTSSPPEDCAAIRARIGVMPAADPVLLRTLAERRDCAFTAAEVYRAAHGDKPPAPADWRDGEHRRHHGHRDHQEQRDDD